jgi:hypothetical protein
MPDDADGGSGSDSSTFRRRSKSSATRSAADPADPFSIDPLAIKPLSHALPLPLPLLILPLLLLLLCAVLALLPTPFMMSATRAVQSLQSKTGLNRLARAHAAENAK